MRRHKLLPTRRTSPRHFVPSIEVLEERLQPTGVPFTIPSSVLNANVVFQYVAPYVISATDPVDQNTDSGNNYAFVTQAFADVYDPTPSGIDGLPNDGFIAGTSGRPDAQLALFGTSANNARRADSSLSGAQSPAQFGFTLDVPDDTYSEIHVFMTSGNTVDVRFTLTLNYTDGTSTTSDPISVPDWFSSISGPGYALVSGLDRERVTMADYQDADALSIWGLPVAANPNKELASFRIDPVAVTGSIVFFGASGFLAPTVTLSGNASVLKDQPYTLNLQYTESATIDNVIINWGDGTIEEYSGQPSSVTHVYRDAPNGYVIHARVFGDFDSVDSNDLLVSVAVPEDGGSQASTVVEAGNTETFTVGGITATTFNNNRLNNIIVTLGVYQDNPVDPISRDVVTVGGVTLLTTPFGTQAEVISYEMRATTPMPGDVIVARFTIPTPGILPGLFFFDDVSGKYLPVRGSTKIANSFRQEGNAFVVIFDETSFPTAMLLRGTVFTITDTQALAASLVTVTQAPPPRPPISAADAFNNLLDTAGGQATGSTVGVVAPTQVNAFTGQNTGAGDSPENAEGRRLSRQIQSVLDGVYEQMRSVFLPQVYFDPSAFEMDLSVPEPRTDEPMWAREEIALTPPMPGRAIEVALAPVAEKANDAPWWLFSERALICLSMAALPMMLKKQPRKKRKGRR